MFPTGKEIVDRSRSTSLPPTIDSRHIQSIRSELAKVRAALLESSVRYKRELQPLKTELHDFLAVAIETRHQIPIPTVVSLPPPRPRKTSVQLAPSHLPSQAHSDRSFHASERASFQAASKHPLDVWLRSAPLFESLPSPAEIESLCARIDIDRIPRPPPNKVEWRTRIANAMNDIPPALRKNMQRLPEAPPAPNDISTFWTTRKQPFPIEELQKQNVSLLHRFMNAFVESKPLPKGEGNDPMPFHALLPCLDVQPTDWLSYTFEERLIFELESAGLGRPVEQTEQGRTGNEFADHISYGE
jgi:hypothetical protein